MNILTFTCGVIDEKCYVLETETSAIVVDPGLKNNQLLEYLEKNKQKVKGIFLTHFHCDHISFVGEVERITGAPVYISEIDNKHIFEPEYNLSFNFPKTYNVQRTASLPHGVKNGEEITAGDITVKVILTPGHTEGSACFLTEDVLFSGDTLFFLSVGRTDLPTGNTETLLKSLKIFKTIDSAVKVYPGHGEPTTVGFEVNNNPYISGEF